MRECDALICRWPGDAKIARLERLTIADAWTKVRQEICRTFDCDPQDVDIVPSTDTGDRREFITVNGLIRAHVTMTECR